MTETESTRAGRTRDHLANERTFLAWVRTALGLIGLGFVLARMGLFVRQLAEMSTTAGVHRFRFRGGREFLASGVAFLLIGTAVCAWSGWRYQRSRKAIDAEEFEPASSSVVALAAVVVAGGLFLVGLVLAKTFGPDEG